MTKRRIDTHRECLEAFARELKRAIKEDMGFWARQNPVEAKTRRLAYSTVIAVLKKQAEEHNIPIVDLGLVDYEVPRIEEL